MKRTIWLVVIIVVLGAGAAIYYDWLPGRKPTQPPHQEVLLLPPSPPVVSVEPAIRHPIETAPVQALPPLGESDAAMQKALAGLIGSKWLAEFFYADRVIRRIVATIDELPRKKVAMSVMPVKPVPGAFVTSGTADSVVIGAKNSARYATYVKIMQALDASKLVEFYVGFYPLFQQAYEELGYPKGYFNDRLIETIDNVLDAPDLKEPARLVQPKVLYKFADPDLEARSAGQKIIMRMGSENAAKVKDKLREIRHEVVLRVPSQ